MNNLTNEHIREVDDFITKHLPPKQIPPAPHSLHDMAYHADVDQLYRVVAKIIDQVELELSDKEQQQDPYKQSRINLAKTILGILKYELRLEP